MDFDNNDVSAEMQEVAEPADVESAETEEAAELPETEPSEVTPEQPEQTKRNEQDAAFAEMRRTNAELQKQLAEQQRQAKQLQEALGLYFEGETAEDLSIAARAYAEQRSADDVRADYEREREYERLTAENKTLHEQLTDIQVDRLMRDALAEIQSIDPTVKDLESLGNDFADYIAAGLSTKQAYYAAKSLEANEKIYAPTPPGKAQNQNAERDYYTSEELDNLTDEEINANREKVWRSMNRL